MNFHDDALETERLMSSYLLRKLDDGTAALFETHYFECDDCFAQLQVAQMLIQGLERRKVARKVVDGVAVLRFRRAAELDELCGVVLAEEETRILIDLSTVTRVDSAGVGALMQCYAHAVVRGGAIKLLNPSPSVRRALRMTGLDSLIETHSDEAEALESFRV
jgi:anti-anti-sigma factor